MRGSKHDNARVMRYKFLSRKVRARVQRFDSDTLCDSFRALLPGVAPPGSNMDSVMSSIAESKDGQLPSAVNSVELPEQGAFVTPIASTIEIAPVSPPSADIKTSEAPQH